MRRQHVRLFAVYGLGYQPIGIWLDDKGDFFASVDSWVTLVPEGWEPVAPELLAAQEAQAEGASPRAGRRACGRCRQARSSSSTQISSMPSRAR